MFETTLKELDLAVIQYRPKDLKIDMDVTTYMHGNDTDEVTIKGYLDQVIGKDEYVLISVARS